MKLHKIPNEVRVVLVRELEIPAEEIEKMSAQEMFDRYCNWHGLINWGDSLWDTVGKLQLSERIDKLPMDEDTKPWYPQHVKDDNRG